MLAGHLGVAAGAKAFDRKVPFWALVVATYLIDLIFGVLVVTGTEEMKALPDTDGGYGEMMFQVDWSHSFFGTILLCLIVLILGARRFRVKGAFILACVVFSHWFLDLIVHRPDLPIAPGNAGNLPRVGLGLWDAPMVSVVVEALLVLTGAFLWYRTRNAEPDDHTVRGQRDRIPMYAAVSASVGLILLGWDAFG